MVRLTSPRALRNLSADPFTTILYRVDAAHKIAYITLNRPKFHNAFGRTTTLEVDEAFLLAQDDENVRVIVLNGKLVPP